LFFGDTSNVSRGGFTYTRGPFPGTDSFKLRVGASDSWTFQDSGGVNSETGAFLSSGGVWTDASSRELKKDISDLSLEKALETVNSLNPVEFTYIGEPGDRKVGFIAEDVPDLVATPSRKGLSAMDIVGVLTKVVQRQHQEVENQKHLINELNERLKNLEKNQN
jgi:glycerol-3-phosphate cytidylyltransferase-like family protein